MKIELKISPAQLVYVATVFEAFCEANKGKWATMTRKDKAAFTIAQDVADKLHNRARTASRPAKAGKQLKVTFKYHEALAVNSFAMHDKDKATDSFIRSLASNIYLQLDPKLT